MALVGVCRSPCAIFSPAHAEDAAPTVVAPEKVDSALWVATSAEYVACARQTFNTAGEKLDLALRDKTWTASTEQFQKGGLPEFAAGHHGQLGRRRMEQHAV